MGILINQMTARGRISKSLLIRVISFILLTMNLYGCDKKTQEGDVPKVSVIKGDGQSAISGKKFAESIGFKVTSGSGNNPLPNVKLVIESQNKLEGVPIVIHPILTTGPDGTAETTAIGGELADTVVEYKVSIFGMENANARFNLKSLTQEQTTATAGAEPDPSGGTTSPAAGEKTGQNKGDEIGMEGGGGSSAATTGEQSGNATGTSSGESSGSSSGSSSGTSSGSSSSGGTGDTKVTNYTIEPKSEQLVAGVSSAFTSSPVTNRANKSNLSTNRSI